MSGRGLPMRFFTGDRVSHPFAAHSLALTAGDDHDLRYVTKCQSEQSNKKLPNLIAQMPTTRLSGDFRGWDEDNTDDDNDDSRCQNGDQVEVEIRDSIRTVRIADGKVEEGKRVEARRDLRESKCYQAKCAARSFSTMLSCLTVCIDLLTP